MNGISKLAVDDTPRAKSKNLDVVAEYERSKAKNAANFVVIGKIQFIRRSVISIAEPARSCRCWQEYTNGKATV